jgi:hypothetical protein
MDVNKIKIKSLKKRIETGPVQFNDDWPGIFIRGDECFAYYLALREVLKADIDMITKSEVVCLMNLLDSSRVR